MTCRPALAMTDRGSGPVILFVHGFMNDATVWDGVIDELVDEFRCIAVDLPGHGASAATGPRSYARDLVLGDLRRVLDTTDAGPAILVGHSLGGYLALALAIEDPERVHGLGLVGAGPGFRNPAARDQWNESVDKLAASRGLAAGLGEISKHVDAMVMDRMSEIQVPVAVVVGERDTRFMASADVFDKHLQVHSRTIVPAAGHMVHLKAPGPVAGALRACFASGR